jgi:hypothetical protein
MKGSLVLQQGWSNKDPSPLRISKKNKDLNLQFYTGNDDVFTLMKYSLTVTYNRNKLTYSGGAKIW